MVLTKESPEVVRLNAAVLALNDAEGRLVLELPDADVEKARDLARAVGVAREEFAAAFDVVENLTTNAEAKGGK